MKIVLFTLPFLMLILFSCKKEQPQLNNEEKNPCDCASEVSADFEIREALNNSVPENNMYTITDDILAEKTAYFKAELEDAQYTWYIGADVENEREISRYFSEQWAGNNIPITLVVKKDPNTNCFPNDDGYDSITKIMRVHDRCDTNIMEGTFRVAEENSTDSFDIIFDFELAYTAPGVFSNDDCRRLDFYNYDGNGSNCIGCDHNLSRNYREIRTFLFSTYGGSPNDCDQVYVRECILDLDNRFYLRYTFTFPDGGTSHELYGRKLN